MLPAGKSFILKQLLFQIKVFVIKQVFHPSNLMLWEQCSKQVLNAHISFDYSDVVHLNYTQ